MVKFGEDSQVSERSLLIRLHFIFAKLSTIISATNGFKIVLTCIIYRIAAFLLLRTTFVPDEYYQSVEPAFKFVYSDNNKLVIPPLTWEWQSEYRIRSYIPILHYILCFRLLKTLSIDYSFLIRNGPRFMQTLYSIIGDLSLYSTSKILFVSEDIARDIVIVNLFSWSGTYCMSRTLINSYETVLQYIGVLLWIICMKNQSKKLWYNVSYIVLVTISIYSRPTSFLWWVIPMIVYLTTDKMRIVYCTLIGLFTCTVCIVIDSYHYNSTFNYPDNGLYTYDGSIKIIQLILSQISALKITITPLNFYIYNVHQNYAELFGVKTWYWTLIEGLPVILGFYTPFIFYELFLYLTRGFCSITDVTLLNYLVFSASFYAITLRIVTSHQEYRFLLPCLPSIHILLGIRYNQMNKYRSKWRILYLVIFVLNVSLASVLLTSHQHGTENSFNYLVNHIKTKNYNIQEPNIINVYVVAPCYSFPGYSYIYDKYQPDIQLRLHSLNCDPLQSQRLVTGSDIYNSLKLEVDDSISATFCHQIDYIVTFDAYKENLKDIINNEIYYELHSIRHSFFKYDYDDPNDNKFVSIYSTEGQSCSSV